MAAVIVTGFHRSATSVAAHWLDIAGLNMGESLMPGHASNAKGHFEDMPVVKFHDTLLRLNSVNWQYHGQVNLYDFYENQTNFIDTYINQRASRSALWGVKDPRASLFLPLWKRKLGDNGKFVFVIRHWSESIESLHKRHFHSIVESIQRKKNPQTNDMAFWQEPQLAAKMWFEYNRRILSFVIAHPNECLVVSQKSIESGDNLPQCLNEKFGLDLNSRSKSPFQSNLITQNVEKPKDDFLFIKDSDRLESLWRKLIAHCDLYAEQDCRTVTSAEVDHLSCEFRPSIKGLNESDFEPDNAILSRFFMLATREDLEKFLVEQESGVLQSLNVDIAVKVDEIINFSEVLESKSIAIEFSDWLYYGQFWKEALSVYVNLHKRYELPPYCYKNMGDCFNQVGNLKLADSFYNQAIHKNSKNANFYVSYALFLKEHGDFLKAKEIFTQGLASATNRDILTLRYAQFLVSHSKTDEALECLEASSAIADWPPAKRFIESLLPKETKKQILEPSEIDSIKTALSELDTNWHDNFSAADFRARAKAYISKFVNN